jgi:hypothetical protein
MIFGAPNVPIVGVQILLEHQKQQRPPLGSSLCLVFGHQPVYPKLGYIFFFFFLSITTIVTCVFINPIGIITIIILKPCALNVEFQHFILRFNKIPLLCKYIARGDRG